MGGRHLVVAAGLTRAREPIGPSRAGPAAARVPAALAATALGGWWLARRALRPIDRITRTAGAIGTRHLDERIAVPHTDDEVAPAGADAERDARPHPARASTDQHRLVSDTSHELRTPLT